MSPRSAEPARNAGGFVDNARALPTTPPAPQQQPGRTFHSPYKADIFTRYRHDDGDGSGSPAATGAANRATTACRYPPALRAASVTATFAASTHQVSKLKPSRIGLPGLPKRFQ